MKRLERQLFSRRGRATCHFQKRSISRSQVRLRKQKKKVDRSVPRKSNEISAFDLFMKQAQGAHKEPIISNNLPSFTRPWEEEEISEAVEDTGPPLTPPLFILAGQSDMGGRCLPDKLPPEYYTSHPYNPKTVYGTIDFKLCWSNDSNALPRGGTSSLDKWHNLTSQPTRQGPRVGPEFAIANALGSRLTTRVGEAYFLKFTMKDSNLHRNWNPLNTKRFGHPSTIGHFQTFIDYCKRHVLNPKFAKENGQPKYKLAGLFWLQGESDAFYKEDAESYMANFRVFMETVRSELKAPNLPVVVSPIVGVASHVELVNKQLHQAGAGDVTDCYCIDNLSVRFVPKPKRRSRGYIGPDGICDIGKRMGETIPLEEDLMAKF